MTLQTFVRDVAIDFVPSCLHRYSHCGSLHLKCRETPDARSTFDGQSAEERDQPRRARKITPNGTSRSSRPPTWPRSRPFAAAWSSSRGVTRSGRTSSACSTGCSRTPAIRTPTSRCSSRSAYLEKEAEHVEGFAKECAVVTHHRLEAESRGRSATHRRAGRAAGRASDQRNDHRRDVRQVGAVVSRSADPHQPMGQRRPLGAAHAAVPAHDRVPLAGRPHRPTRRAKRRSKRR